MPNHKQIIEAHYAGFAAGDFAAVLASLADDIVWKEADGFPLAGTYHGRDAVVANVFTALQRDWIGFTVAIDEVLDAGDSVIGVGTYSGTYRATARSFSARVVHLWRLQDGKAVRFEQITDTAMVNAAVD